MGDKAFVTPAVLKWARETARMTAEQAAAKSGVAAQKVMDWEEGVDKPTIRQAELLANAYKRPFCRLYATGAAKRFHPAARL